MRILLIENNDNDAFLIRQMLSDEPHLDITRAERLQAALRLLETSAFDVVLLDLALPDSSGYQTFVTIRDRSPETAILIISSHSDGQLASRALREGAQDFLPKDQLSGYTLARAIKNAYDRRQASLALASSDESSRAAFNALSAHIAILDETGRILVVNDAWRRFGEQNGNALAGRTGDNYLDICDAAVGCASEGAAEVANAIRRVISGELSNYDREYPCNSPDEERWFALHVTRFVTHGLVRVVTSHENISQRKRAEAMEGERLALADAMKAMSQVLGIVGHELRTPLAGLRAMSEYLLDPEARDTPEYNHFLHAINSEVIRMTSIVDNLLEAARLNSGHARWNWDTFVLGQVCRDVVESTRPLIDESRVTLACNVQTPEAEVSGDPGACARLLVNLIDNARKHTAAGRIDVDVAVNTQGGHQWMQLTVSDTGTGIDPAIISRLGEAFALNSGVVGMTHVSGTGLGLAICNATAASHGGSIAIDSTRGGGTRVTVRMRADLEGPLPLPKQPPPVQINN